MEDPRLRAPSPTRLQLEPGRIDRKIEFLALKHAYQFFESIRARYEA